VAATMKRVKNSIKPNDRNMEELWMLKVILYFSHFEKCILDISCDCGISHIMAQL
jgi:hypothetical protein